MYVSMRKFRNSNIIRFQPFYDVGLSFIQVEQRENDKLVNRSKRVFGKSIAGIIYSNTFTLFNLLLSAIAGAMLYFGLWHGILMVAVVFINTIIGLSIDIGARHFLKKLKPVSKPTVMVVRESRVFEIYTDKIVLDDVLIFGKGSEICVDGVVLDGEIHVNESFITGNAFNTYKGIGDKVFSHTFVTEGKACVRADKIGKHCLNNSIENKTKRFNRPKSLMLRSFDQVLGAVGITTVMVTLFVLLLFYFQGELSTPELIANSVDSIVGSLATIIPSLMYLFSFVILACSISRLGKKKTKILDLFSVGTLARANMICIDKTGTLTDGNFSIKKTMIISRMVGEEDIAQIMSNLLIATKDNSTTAEAFRKVYDLQLSAGINAILPFNGDYKYTGASFKGGKTFILGDPEFMPLKNKVGLLNRCEEYIKDGYRVMILGEGKELITNNKFNGDLNALAIFVIKDCVREEALKTIKYFAENNKCIKVISGDNPQTVSSIALEAGISDANNFVSLENMSIGRVKDIASKYTIFGHATAEQKEMIVMGLQEKGNTVAMIGDGVNDILALKRSDCSIAMASGDESARNLSHIVLVDSDFSKLIDADKEGGRVVNNLRRVVSLFLARSIFAFFLTIFFALKVFIITDPSSQYSFVSNNLFLWEIITCGFAGLLLTFESNNEKIKSHFLRNIFRKAIPFALMLFGVVFIFFILQYMQQYNIVDFGIYSTDTTIAMSVISISVLTIIYLYKICKPLTKYRRAVIAASASINLIALAASAAVTYITGQTENILKIPYLEMSGPSYMITLFVTVLVSGIYLLVNYLVSVKKGEIKENEN